jgi:hypothetical protein
MAPKAPKRAVEEQPKNDEHGPPSNKKTTPTPKVLLTVVQNTDKKDAARTWVQLHIDPGRNIRVMSRIEKFRRSIMKGKLQPVKPGQIEYLTNGGASKVTACPGIDVMTNVIVGDRRADVLWCCH